MVYSKHNCALNQQTIKPSQAPFNSKEIQLPFFMF
jgi:hypothetical protein